MFFILISVKQAFAFSYFVNYTNQTTYNINNFYFFNITITNTTENENITACNFTLEFNGSPTIYDNNSVYLNSTTPPTLCFINFTQDELGPAGEYNFSWSILNDTDWFDTEEYNFTINKAPVEISLFVNSNESDAEVDFNQTVNFTIFTNVSGRHVELWSNYSGSWEKINDGTEPLITLLNLSEGYFNFTANFLGDENYTEALETFFVNVSNIPPRYFNEGLPNDRYSLNKTYQFNITWQDGSLNEVIFNIYNTSEIGFEINYTLNSSLNEFDIVIVNNDTKIFIANVTDLPAGSYNYSWCASDSLGLTNCTNVSEFGVIKSNPSLSLTISPSNSIYEGNSTIINCTKITGDPSSILKILRNGTEVGYSGTSYAAYSSNSLAAGVWNFTCTISESQNFTSYSVTDFLTVNSVPITLTPTTPPTTGSFTISSSVSVIALKPNSSSTITITLKNNYGYNITKINITVSGVDVSWYTLSKTNIPVLQKNGGTDTVLLDLHIPENAERKNYTITVLAVGSGTSGKLTREITIRLIIPEELPQNVSIENETYNVTITNQTSQGNVTETSMNIAEIANYAVPIIALISVALIFIFRNEITIFLTGKKYKPHVKHEIKVTEKLRKIFSNLKKKIAFLSQYRLVIQVSKKKKEEKA